MSEFHRCHIYAFVFEMEVFDMGRYESVRNLKYTLV